MKSGREYAKVCSSFWTGDTGRAVQEEGAVTTLVALYTLTSPHALATGLYRLPTAYITHDTGLSPSQVEGAFSSLTRVGFMEREGDIVWVRNMGAFQVSDTLKPKDSRRVWVHRSLAPFTGTEIYRRFFQVYGRGWGLTPPEAPPEGVMEGTTDPLLPQEQEPKHDHPQDQPSGPHAPTPSDPLPTPAPLEVPPRTAPEARSRWWGESQGNARAKLPDKGRRVAYQVTSGGERRGATVFGGPMPENPTGANLVRPGPRLSPAEVRILEEVLPLPTRHFHPAPPRLPDPPSGHSCRDLPADMEDAYLSLMAQGYSAARHFHEGKPYRGHGGRWRGAVIESARILHAAGVPPHTWFTWVWARLVRESRSTRPPGVGFNNLASPALVGSNVRKCPSLSLDRVEIQTDSRSKYLHACESVRVSLLTTEHSERRDLRSFLDSVVDGERLDSLRKDVENDAADIVKRDQAKLSRGFYVWNN